jgi:hypothetical protein
MQPAVATCRHPCACLGFRSSPRLLPLVACLTSLPPLPGLAMTVVWRASHGFALKCHPLHAASSPLHLQPPVRPPACRAIAARTPTGTAPCQPPAGALGSTRCMGTPRRWPRLPRRSAPRASSPPRQTAAPTPAAQPSVCTCTTMCSTKRPAPHRQPAPPLPVRLPHPPHTLLPQGEGGGSLSGWCLQVSDHWYHHSMPVGEQPGGATGHGAWAKGSRQVPAVSWCAAHFGLHTSSPLPHIFLPPSPG